MSIEKIKDATVEKVEAALAKLKKAEADQDEAILELASLYVQTSHEANCSYRHKGECDCIKWTVAEAILGHNAEVP
jgi:hypothetical protein